MQKEHSHSDLERQIINLESAISEVRSDVSTGISSLEDRMSSLKSDLGNLESKVSVLEDVVEEIRKETKQIHKTMQNIASSINAFAGTTEKIQQSLSETEEHLSSSNELLHYEISAEKERHSTHMELLGNVSEAQESMRDTLDDGFKQIRTNLQTLAEGEKVLREQVTESFTELGKIMEKFRVNMNNRVSDLIDQIGHLGKENQVSFEKNAKVLQDILGNREKIIRLFTTINTDLQNISSSMKIVVDSEKEEQTKENLQKSARMNDLGLYLLATGQAERAVTILENAAELSPDQPEILFNLGNAYLSIQAFDGAEITFQEIIERFPEWGQAFLGLSVVYIQQKKYEEAMESLNRVEEILPNSAEVMVYKGFVHFHLEAPQDAYNCWKRAVQIDPRLTTSFKTIGLKL